MIDAVAMATRVPGTAATAGTVRRELIEVPQAGQVSKFPAADNLPRSTQPAASAPLQSVYHFTVGVPLSDARIATEPPYAHLLTDRKGTDHD